MTALGNPRRPLTSLLLKNLQSGSNVRPRDTAFFSSITQVDPPCMDSRWLRLVCESGKKISAPKRERCGRSLNSIISILKELVAWETCYTTALSPGHWQKFEIQHFLHNVTCTWSSMAKPVTKRGRYQKKSFLIPAIFPRGLFTVSLDGLSERETTCNPLWRLLTPKWSQIINIIIKLIKPMAAIIRKWT